MTSINPEIAPLPTSRGERRPSAASGFAAALDEALRQVAGGLPEGATPASDRAAPDAVRTTADRADSAAPSRGGTPGWAARQEQGGATARRGTAAEARHSADAGTHAPGQANPQPAAQDAADAAPATAARTPIAELEALLSPARGGPAGRAPAATGDAAPRPAAPTGAAPKPAATARAVLQPIAAKYTVEARPIAPATERGTAAVQAAAVHAAATPAARPTRADALHRPGGTAAPEPTREPAASPPPPAQAADSSPLAVAAMPALPPAAVSAAPPAPAPAPRGPRQDGQAARPAAPSAPVGVDAPSTTEAAVPARIVLRHAFEPGDTPPTRLPTAEIVRRETHFVPVATPTLSAPQPAADPAAAATPASAAPDAGSEAAALPQVLGQLRDALEGLDAGRNAAATTVERAVQPAIAPLRIVELQLQPATLGTVTVTLRLSSAGLKVSVAASVRETAQRLADDRAELTDLVRRAGYRDADVTIDYAAPAGDASASDTGGGGAGGDHRNRAAGDRPAAQHAVRFEDALRL